MVDCRPFDVYRARKPALKLSVEKRAPEASLEEVARRRATRQFSAGRHRTRCVLGGRGGPSALASEPRAHLLHSIAVVTPVGRHLAEVSQGKVVLYQRPAVVVEGLQEVRSRLGCK